jgi:hypothetical protein
MLTLGLVARVIAIDPGDYCIYLHKILSRGY